MTTIYPPTDYRALRGEALRQANREYFASGTGPRADFERRCAEDARREREARAIFDPVSGPLVDVAARFAGILAADSRAAIEPATAQLVGR